MERDDAVLLHEPDLMLAVLRVAATGAGTLEACIEHLRALRDRAEVEHRVPEARVRAELQAIAAKLDRASLIEWRWPRRFRITARGRQVLADHPAGVDEGVLRQLEAPDLPTGRPASVIEREAPQASAYDAGYHAYAERRGLPDNPHPPDARAHLDWQNGWSQACEDEQKRSRRI